MVFLPNVVLLVGAAHAAGISHLAAQQIAVPDTVSIAGYFGGFDLQGDGYDDVIVVASDGVWLYAGGAAGLSTSPRSLPSPTGTVRSVAAVGDVNGDGVDDVLMCDSGAATDTGAVWLMLGASSGPPRRAALRVGRTAGGEFGKGCAGVGDVNGDGYNDYAVGFSETATRDAVRVYAGGASPGTLLASIGRFGRFMEVQSADGVDGGSVSGVGDVDGDGYADLAVGALLDGRNDDRILVYPGGPAGPATSPSVTIAAPWANGGSGGASYFGASLGPAGDIDGDGYDDVVVVASGEAWLYGSIYVFWGSAAGLTASDYAVTTGEDDGGAYAVWGGAAFDDSAGDDLLLMGYEVIQTFEASRAGVSVLDVLWWTDSADVYESPIYSTFAGDVNGDGCSDVFTRLWSMDATTWASTYPLALFTGDCS